MVKTATLVAAVALVVAGVGAVQAAGPGDGPASPTTTEPEGGTDATSTSAREAGEDVRGPCDEAEHAGDPRCGGSAPTGDGGGSYTVEEVDDDRGGDHGHRGRGGDDDENRSGSNSGRS